MNFSASILGVNVFSWKGWWNSLSRTPIRRLHYDVTDGHFTNSISFGSAFLIDFKNPSWKLEGHFMVDFKTFSFAQLTVFWNNFLPYLTTFICHLESLRPQQIHFFFDYCQKNHLKKGLALKLETDWKTLLPYLKELDHLLLMAVPVGASNQKFQPSLLPKLVALQEYRKNNSYQFFLEVDGGINQTTLPLVANKGADSVVLGSFLRPFPEEKFKILALN